MDDRLKDLIKNLGDAIIESLSVSYQLTEAISEIKNAGYDVFMILEATVGFNKREESGDQESKPSQPVGLAKWNSQDQAFLGAMKISLDE